MSSHFKRPRRRWLQYSLRGLLLLMLLSAFGAWWLKSKIDAATREERALAELAKLGDVHIAFDFQQTPDGSYDPNRKTPDDSLWLRQMFGDAFVDDPVVISVPPTAFSAENAHWIGDLPSLEKIHVSSGHRESRMIEPGAVQVVGTLKNLTFFDCVHVLNDEDISALGNLHELEDLRIGSGSFSQSGIDRLTRDLPRLETLSISGATFGPGALRGLARLPSLKRLGLSYCTFENQDFSSLALAPIEFLHVGNSNLMDAALVHIGQLKTLKELNLALTGVTDAGLAQLTSLQKLETLTLTMTQISDAGLESIGKLKSLRDLSFGYCPELTGAGFFQLTSLTQIEYLDLTGTHTDDESLIALQQIPSLKNLRLFRTDVTDGGIANLRGTNLHWLRLPNAITDASMPSLLKIRGLRDLELSPTMTEAVIPELLQMQSLERLDVPTGFSPAGVQSLKNGLPNCRVTVGGR